MNNYQRMMKLIGEVFNTRNDPDQLQVTEKDRKKLMALHPSTLSEFADENGPAVWVLIIPTTVVIMHDFINGKISEKEILNRTKVGDIFESIYLCSATTLPEYRGKGITKNLTLNAIGEIKKAHPIKYLFVWPFTGEGDHLAEAVANASGLELLKRTQ